MTIDLLNVVADIDTAELRNMTEVQAGGKGRAVLPSGTAFVRLSGYIEFGTQKQRPYQGKAKDPEPEFRLQFKVVGGVGTNEAGEDEDYVIDGYQQTISTYDTPLKQYQKAKAVALFNAINVTPNTATHFMHKIGQLYTLKIGTKKNDQGKVVQDIDFTDLQPATDPATRKPYKTYANKDGNDVTIPELDPKDVSVFLWTKPTSVTKEQYQAMWDSIHIAGEYEVKDGDKTIKKSKNFLQEKCLSALDFEGSSLQQLLDGVELPTLTAPPDEEVEQEVKAVAAPADEAGEIAVPDED